MSLILIYVTNPSRIVARRIAKHLLKKKLIACANIYNSGVHSLYSWKGKIAEEKEVPMILKTVPKNWERVKAEIEKVHPYSIPCIIKIPASANRVFEDWVKESIS